MNPWKQLKFWWNTRGMTEEQKTNVKYGLDPDFELPHLVLAMSMRKA